MVSNLAGLFRKDPPWGLRSSRLIGYMYSIPCYLWVSRLHTPKCEDFLEHESYMIDYFQYWLWPNFIASLSIYWINSQAHLVAVANPIETIRKINPSKIQRHGKITSKQEQICVIILYNTPEHTLKRNPSNIGQKKQQSIISSNLGAITKQSPATQDHWREPRPRTSDSFAAKWGNSLAQAPGHGWKISPGLG